MAPTRLELGPSTSARHFRTALESSMASDAKKSNYNVNCCVPLCNQKGQSRRAKGKIFFSLLPEGKLTDVWLAKIRREKGEYFKVKDTAKLCSLHFESREIKKGFGGKWSLFVTSVLKCLDSMLSKPAAAAIQL